MDIKKYISSGILDEYVLGLTSEQETLEVKKMAAEYPEIKKYIDENQYALEKYATVFDKKPPTDLQDRIWSKIQENESQSKTDTPILNIKRKKKNNTNFKWLAAAVLVLLIISSVWNAIMYNNVCNTKETIAKVKTHLSKKIQAQNNELSNSKTTIAFLSEPETQKILLKGIEKFPQALATVYWNKKSNKVFLQATNLPVPPTGKQYQLWAIIDGNPVSAGILNVNAKNKCSFQPMNKFKQAQAFAITLEKQGGATKPTLTAMYVMGKV